MPDHLVTVGSYSTAQEAYLVQSELEAFGVDAVLEDENLVRLDWLYSNLLGGVKVRVPDSLVDDACAILDAPLDRGAAPPDEPEETTVCPACGSAETAQFLDRKAACLTWLVVGIPLIFPRWRNACRNCGHKWTASA